MKNNVGPADRFIRFLLGLAFLMNVIVLEPSKGGMFILIALGLTMWYTAFAKYCFLYDIIGVCTCSKEECQCAEGEGSEESSS